MSVKSLPVAAGHLSEVSEMSLMRPELGSATNTEQFGKHLISVTVENMASEPYPSTSPAAVQDPA